MAALYAAVARHSKREVNPLPPLWRDWRFYILVLATLLSVALAYQVRLPASVDIGALGDRAYLWASPLLKPDRSDLEDTGFNGDEHLVAEKVDYRWTKRVSWVRLPDLGWNGPLRVTLRVRGWRPEGLPLPMVDVRVNGAPAGRFQASADWQVQSFTLTTSPGHSADVEVSLETTPWTDATQDKRVLGVQWDWVRVEPLPGGSFPAVPPWRQLLLWSGTIALLYTALRRWLKKHALWVGLGLAALLAVGMALVRPILTPYAGWSVYVAGALFLLAHLDLLGGYLRQLGRRARDLPFWAALVGAGVLVLISYVRWAVGAVPTLAPRPDAILVVIFVSAAAIYALTTWERPQRQLFASLDRKLCRPWLSGALLALLVAGVTIYEFGFIQEMRFIGHADYADNAVVARNLLAGKGFTVDYVTQFYNPDLALSHPQETWPLLQPVLIAPFFRLLGDSPFAAKLPNLFLQVALALVVYALGTNLFDRRVGLLAVLLLLLNRFIFRLIIFPTSDLAFTLLAMLTLAQLFRAGEREQEGARPWGSYAWAGVWAGLMMLAKPNGAIFVVIALAWDLFWRWRDHRWQGWWKDWLALGIPAALLFAPWVVRNIVLFGAPIHSTEATDAWILKYRDWEEIYRVYYSDVPNRSWLLRYGFDAVFQAVGTEFTKWRQYFTVDSNSLLTLAGSALALGGLFTLRKKPARLFSLVGAVLLLFGTVICTYWHVEERYFVPFIPWLVLLAARGLWWIYDALAYRRDEEGRRSPRGWAWLGLVVVVLVCSQLVAPFFQEAAAKVDMDRGKASELQAYTWLAENSDPQDVVMTRVPWQLTYYTGRRSVMIPQGGLQEIQGIAEKYGASYLFLEDLARNTRPALRNLPSDSPWKLVYGEGGIQIYQLGEGK
jgi:hypothetical protein